MDRKQLTSDLQALVNQGIISQEQAINMMKESGVNNNNNNNTNNNNAGRKNLNTSNYSSSKSSVSSSLLDDKIASLLNNNTTSSRGEQMPRTNKNTSPILITNTTTTTTTTTSSTSGINNTTTKKSNSQNNTNLNTLVVPNSKRKAPITLIAPSNDTSVTNNISSSQNSQVKRPTSATTFSDSLSIQTNTRSITMAQEEEFQAIDNVVGNKKLRSVTTTNIKHKQNVVQNTQTQRPRSTGHEDSEKKHLYPTHSQSKSEIPYDKSNAVGYDEIFSSLQYQQKQQKSTDDRKSPGTIDRNAGSSGRNSKSPNIMQNGSSSKPRTKSTTPSRNSALSKLLLKKEKDINTVKAVFLVNGVDKSWMSRRLQRAFDQWIMYANMLRNREMADRITISRKQEEELHGASLRKITQEFVRVSEKISNFDRTEKKLREQNRSLNTKVLTLEEQMTKMKEANQTLKDKLGNTEKNLEQVIASRRQKGYNGNNNNNREKDDVLVNSVIDVMEDSLRVLDVDKNKNSRGNNTSGNDMMQTADVKNRNNKRPRLRSPTNFNVQQQQQYSNRPSSNSRKEEEEGQEEKGEIIEKSNNNNEQVGITMEELENIQLKMQNHCRKNNIVIDLVFTDNEKQFGKDIVAFVETLETIGLSLNILEGFELVGLLKILDSNNNETINVHQFVQFLSMVPDEGNNDVMRRSDNNNATHNSSTRPDNRTPRHKQHYILDRNIYNTRKSSVINDYFHNNRRSFINLYKNFANTNSSNPWIDYERWMNFSKNCGLVTGHLSRRQIEALFKQSSSTTARGRINFQMFLQLLVNCASTMSGPYQYVEERMAFLFKRFGECGHSIPNGNMILTRVLQTKAVETSPWNTPMMSGNAGKSNKIESMEDNLGSPAMEYDSIPPQRQQQEGKQQQYRFDASSSNAGGFNFNVATPSSTAYSVSGSSNRSYGTPVFGQTPIEELGVRDISTLKAKLNTVAKLSSASTFRKFLMVQPSPSLSYTRFTRLIRESLRKSGYAFSGNEAAYLLRAVDPQGDGIIFGNNLKKFLGIAMSPRQPQWGSPSAQLTNINKSFSNRDTYVERQRRSQQPQRHPQQQQEQQQSRRPRRLDHNNSRQVMSNAKKLNDLRNMLEQSLGDTNTRNR